MFLPCLLSHWTCLWPHLSNIQLQCLLRKFKHSKIRKINTVSQRERKIGTFKANKRGFGLPVIWDILLCIFIAISKYTWIKMTWDCFNTTVLKWRACPGLLCFWSRVASVSLCFYFYRGPELPYSPVWWSSYVNHTWPSLLYFLTPKILSALHTTLFPFFHQL